MFLVVFCHLAQKTEAKFTPNAFVPIDQKPAVQLEPSNTPTINKWCNQDIQLPPMPRFDRQWIPASARTEHPLLPLDLYTGIFSITCGC